MTDRPASAVVKINAIHVPPGAGEELERRFAARAGAVESAPGFLGFQLLRPVAGDDRYFVVTQWADEESFAAWRDGQGRAAHAGQGESAKPVSSGADLLEFEVVLDVAPRH
ncbi:MAG: antibiotic biosynthesis monooxygenase [Candidatus Nanopelagicales bacterium]|nr:antibiotic biosynthesis monooxygenase [Candidatus Nanopelagicales bacterium]MCF8537948.1 antibiotic biosynthesis monooxygenase [Candidatus Nanopelagicales bacterium]MCF8543060.1 antibiotic biosynthesis monooxygenase [Candidatus Nanopelagicales bacterium]MCF8556237.1 antibiotic biosynthesis monooxygenase [Candidatus Nanopelagicales bacterium]